MADKDKLRFLTGQEANLKDKTLVRGQVYFAISSDTDSGKIYFDAPIDNNTTKRILMSSDHAKTADKATSADRATADSNGRKFTETYISEIKLDNAGTTILYKYPDITTWKELKPKFLPLTGGTITGELYADSITAGDLLVNGSARFVNTILGNIETANQWKTARGFQIADSDAAHTSVTVNVNGSSNVVLKLPSTIKAALQGNASSANKVNHKYTLTLGTTKQTAFDGSADVAITITPESIGALSKDEASAGAAKWSTARMFYVADADASNTGTGVSVDGSKDITLKLPSTIKASITGHASKDLPLTGGTMTGNINFANNIGITAAMGGGSDGWGIIGTGTNDNGRLKIYVTDNGTTDWIDFEFRDYSGTIYTPLSMTGNQVLFASNIRPTANNTYSLGTNDYKWSSIYATTFYGALSGTASHATSDIRGNAIINTYLTNVYAKSDDSSYLYKQVGPTSERNPELIGRYTPLDSNGLINMKYIPAAALERVVVVADQAAQYALTTANVQLGDVVKRNDTGQLYFVVDTNNLGNAGGYLQFTAGTAANVNWSGILNRPNIVGRATGNAIVPNAANTEFTVYQVNGDGTSTSYVIKPNFLPITGGTITGDLQVNGGTTLNTLSVSGDATFTKTIQGSISGNAATATKWSSAKAFYIADAEAKHTSSPSVNIDGSQSSYTLKLPSTIKATLEGNADTATKLTNLTEADKASSTNTWRRVWFAYDDNVNGRPAYSDTFAYQTSTGTVKATKFQGDLVGNADSASKWKTARNFITNLGSETAASVDGSTGPYNLGVTGILPVSHGGTGATSIANIQAGKDADGNTITTTYFRRYRNSNTYGSGYANLNGTMPPFLQAYKNGYPLHTDPEFASGMNGIARYDNAGSGKTTVERIDMACGNSTGKVLRIRNTGTGPSPNLGGWYFSDATAYARQYVCIFRAKVPTGYTINWHSNSCGTNSTTYWVTDHVGTGKWEWYAYFVDSGSDNFSSTMYFALDGTAGTADKPVDWFLSYANDIILSYGAYDGLRTRYTDNADKWTNARNFITNLGSESFASVDGSTGPYNLGVTGTLPISHGGTGNTTQTANRAIYAETASKLSSSGHYMSSNKMAINSTSEPSYQFYVNGTSYFSGITTHTAAVNFANGTWNLVGDDVYFGDHNVVGGFGILGKNGNTRLDFCQYNAATIYQSIIFDGSTLYASSKFGVNGSNSTYNFYVNGTSSLNGNLTVTSSGVTKLQNTTDSKNSQDSNASLAIQGGVSVAKQLSAKTIRIDGSSSDTIGSTTQGCTVHFNKTNNCIEFVFD